MNTNKTEKSFLTGGQEDRSYRINRRVEGHGRPDRADAGRGSLTEAPRHRGESEWKC